MNKKDLGTSHLANPYISQTYGSLLTHERRIAQRHIEYKNRVHLDVTVASHNKKKDQTKFNP